MADFLKKLLVLPFDVIFAQSLRERTTLNKTFSIGVSHTRKSLGKVVKSSQCAMAVGNLLFLLALT